MSQARSGPRLSWLGRLLEAHPTLAQLARFLVVGSINTAVDLAVLNALMIATGRAEGWFYAGFKVASFTCAATLSYFLNKRFTFRDRSRYAIKRKLAGFYVISVIGALINVSVASSVVEYVGPALREAGAPSLTPALWGNIGALCGSALGIGWNFTGYKLLIFKPSEGEGLGDG